MCGITGYIGENPETTLLYKLTLLEYRGYDSAGIAVKGKAAANKRDTIAVTKRAGDLRVLKEAVQTSGATPDARFGIGHTRWATHGKPDETNAHPHVSSDGKWAVVHNGIIENYLSLKNELIAKGYAFYGETDTETIAKLLEYYEAQGFSSPEAVKRTCERLTGSFALAILHEGDDGIFFAKNKSPLYLAAASSHAAVKAGNTLPRTEKHCMIASDTICFRDFADEYYALPDGTYGFATEYGVRFYDKNGETEITPERVSAAEFSAENAYPHYMLKEIYETKDAIARAAKFYKKSLLPENYPPLSSNAFSAVKLVGCGTAYHAALAGARMIENATNLDCAVFVGSEFRYAAPKMNEHTLVVLVSQSGETADTLAALEEAKEKGAKTLAVVNAEHSTLAKNADMILPVKAGAEIAVASTKAYTCQLTALYALAKLLEAAEKNAAYPDLSAIDTFLSLLSFGNERELKEIAATLGEGKQLFMIGRGGDYFTALEASLKIKETSYVNADVYYAGELKHGFLALVDQNSYVIVFATNEKLLSKTLANAAEAQARGAKIILFTTAENLCGNEDKFYRVLRVPSLGNDLQFAENILPWQLIAYYLSVSKGLNPDKPRNLAKSVTVE